MWCRSILYAELVQGVEGFQTSVRHRLVFASECVNVTSWRRFILATYAAAAIVLPLRRANAQPAPAAPASIPAPPTTAKSVDPAKLLTAPMATQIERDEAARRLVLRKD